MITVKKQQGLLMVTIKQKESTEKFMEFTPSRYSIAKWFFIMHILHCYNLRV